MGSLCTTYACQIGARSKLMTTDIKLAIFSPSEVSGTYRADFASMILRDGRQNPSATIKVPQDSSIRCFFLVSLGSAFNKRKKSQMLSIRSRLTLTTSGDSDRE